LNAIASNIDERCSQQFRHVTPLLTINNSLSFFNERIVGLLNGFILTRVDLSHSDIALCLDLGGHPKPAIKGHFKTGQR